MEIAPGTVPWKTVLDVLRLWTLSIISKWHLGNYSKESSYNVSQNQGLQENSIATLPQKATDDQPSPRGQLHTAQPLSKASEQSVTVRREHGRRACVTDTELSSTVGSSGTELRGPRRKTQQCFSGQEEHSIILSRTD